jgi:hypothetical protein
MWVCVGVVVCVVGRVWVNVCVIGWMCGCGCVCLCVCVSVCVCVCVCGVYVCEWGVCVRVCEWGWECGWV